MPIIDPYIKPEGIKDPFDSGGTEEKKISPAAFSALKMMKSIPSSAVGVGRGYAQPIVAPVETGVGLSNLLSGAITKGASHVLPVPAERLEEQDVKTYETVKDFYKSRYGNWEGFKNALMEDPVGVASDLSAAFGAAGATLPGKAGKVASTAAKFSDPLTPIKAASSALGKNLSSGARTIYESALKVPPSVNRETRLAAIEQGLKLGIPVSEHGAVKIYDRISKTGDQLSKAINQAGGKSVNINRIMEPIADLRSFYDNAIGTVGDIKWLDDFMEKEKLRLVNKYGGEEIPIKAAQELKQNTYRLLKNKYGELKSIEIEAQKQVSRGLKEEIEKQLIDTYPGLKQLNKALGEEMNLSSFIDRALNRTSNYDLARLTTKAGMAAGGAISGKPGAMIGGLISNIIDSPKWKSYIALNMKKAAKLGVDVKYNSLPRNLSLQAARPSMLIQPEGEESNNGLPLP